MSDGGGIVQLDGFPKLGFSLLPLPVVEGEQMAEGGVGVGELRGELDGAVGEAGGRTWAYLW